MLSVRGRRCWSLVAVAAVAVVGLILAACAPAPATPTAAPTVAAPSGKIPILSGIPNAPPRPTATPRPPDYTPPPPPPTPAPPEPKVVPVYAYIDTVTSGPGESKYNVDPTLSCVKSSLHARGMQIVWRMELVDTSTGKVLQGTDVKEAILKLPNGEEVKFRYGRHGTTDDAPWFWTAAWSIPPDYPLGVLDYAVTVTTQDGKSTLVKDPLRVSLPARNIESALVIVPAEEG